MMVKYARLFILYFYALFLISPVAVLAVKVDPTTREIESSKVSYKPTSKKEEILMLALNTFLYTSDLENAYRVAKKGVELFPNSIYWRSWLAKLSLWTQRPEEAYENLLFIYKKGLKKEVEENLYNLSLTLRKYETALEILEDKVRKGQIDKLEEIVYLYENLGEPEKGISFLTKLYESSKDQRILGYIAQVQYRLSPLKALELYEKLYEQGLLKENDLLNYVNILFVKGETEKAYRVLKGMPIESVEYYENLSDLAWLLKDYDTALMASSKLIELGKEREEDYVRVILVLLEKDFGKVKDLSLNAFKKFKKAYIFYFVAEAYRKDKDYRGLYNILSYLSEEEKRMLEGEEFYWYLKTELFTKLGYLNLARKTAEEMLKRFPNSSDVLITYLWILVDIKDYEKVNEFLMVWEDKLKKDIKALNALSAANALLTRFNRSINYLQEYLREENNPYLIYEISELFYNAGMDNYAEYYRHKAWTQLNKLKENNPELRKDGTFLEYYIRAGMHFLNPAQMEKLFKEAEAYMDNEKYKRLRLSYEFFKGNQDKAEFLIKRKGWEAEDWMKLSMALNQYDKDLMEKVLQKSAIALPIRDRVEAYRRTGNTEHAQEFAFYGLEKNPDDYLLYKQYRDLMIESADNLRINASYTNRSSVDMISTSINLRHHLNRKYFVDLHSDNVYVSSYDSNKYRNLPSFSWMSTLYLGRKLDRGEIKVGVGRSQYVESNTSFELSGKFYIYKNTSVDLGFGKNVRADESVYLLFGGLKDRLFLTLTHALTPKTFVYNRLEYSSFSSQDDEKVGYGFQNYAEIYRKLRVGYPDYTLRTFLSSGFYKEKEGGKGSLDKLTGFTDTKFLPQSFNELGIGFNFGYENRELYTRVWRPFMDISLSFNTRNGLNYSVFFGIGGKILKQDNLSLELGYSRRLRGAVDGFKRFDIRYLRLY